MPAHEALGHQFKKRKPHGGMNITTVWPLTSGRYEEDDADAGDDAGDAYGDMGDGGDAGGGDAGY